MQAFKTSFTFIPNGFNLAFVANNAVYALSCDCGGWDFPWNFNAGAGAEVFGQFAGGPNISPIQVFAMELDSYSPLTNGGSFSYSSTQIYSSPQSPVLPVTVGDGYLPAYSINKISTSPVPLNSPATTQASASTDTFSVTLYYNGKTFTEAVYDATAGGSCPGASCFYYTWQGVNIPGIVGSNSIDSPTDNLGQAWVGLMGGTSAGTGPALQILTFSYTPLSFASAPTISNSGGTITLSTGSSGADIFYNTTGAPGDDGNGNALPGSTKYTGPFTLTNSGTVYAVAGSGSTFYGDSTVASSAITIGTTAAMPTFNPSGGTYQGKQYVYLSAPAGASIFYSTSGTATCSSTAYTGAITVSANKTLSAINCASGLTASTASSASYVLNLFSGSGSPLPADPPVPSIAPGAYTGTQAVTLTSDTTGAYICHVESATPPTFYPQPNNGSAELPPNGGTTVPGICTVGTYLANGGTVTVSLTEHVYAVTGTTWTTYPSSMVDLPYTISGTSQAATPTFSPAAGTYSSTQTITISDSTASSTIYYTTDGSTPTTSSSVYSTPLTVASSTTVQAVAIASGYTLSSVGSAAYTITLPTAATPTLSPSTGTYTTTQAVTIADSTSGSTIYYTIDGSTPTTSSAVYSSALTVSSTTTVKALAVASGYNNSGVGSAIYTITAPPVTGIFMQGSPVGTRVIIN